MKYCKTLLAQIPVDRKNNLNYLDFQINVFQLKVHNKMERPTCTRAGLHLVYDSLLLK